MADIAAACSSAAPAAEPEPARPDLSSISSNTWERLESAAQGVLNVVHPTAASEHFRAAIIDYLQRILTIRPGVQVFPFGSVPLKTYLPDGDIDLSIFGPMISDDNLANEICDILRSEELRKDSEFDVKDVQCIPAEVDQNFGKKNLFKRSVVLIKVWCYYESRILGAQFGLLSTYALEILVLYVFHTFHRSLSGPLSVLYKFLDFYSKFDWDNKGISLFGPVSLSSLPDLVTDPHLGIHDHLFHSWEKFLRECTKEFRAPPRNSGRDAQVFSRKLLNIVDPLKQGNNLGRSVSKGNFYRICSAFDLGARKLGKILHTPVPSTANDVNQFFSNTLKKNHTGFRPDDTSSPLYSNPCAYQVNNILKSLTGDFDTNCHNLQYAQRFQQVNPVRPFYYGRLASPPRQYQNTRPSDGRGRKNPHAYASMNGAVSCPPRPSGYFVRRTFTQPHNPMKLCRDRPPAGRGERGRNQFTSNNYQRFHHHDRTDMPADMGSGQEFRHQQAQIHIPGATDHGRPSPSPNSTRDQLKD